MDQIASKFQMNQDPGGQTRTLPEVINPNTRITSDSSQYKPETLRGASETNFPEQNTSSQATDWFQVFMDVSPGSLAQTIKLCKLHLH